MPFSLIPRIKYRRRQAEEMLCLCRENIRKMNQIMYTKLPTMHEQLLSIGIIHYRSHTRHKATVVFENLRVIGSELTYFLTT